jgi:hypothetical protein
MLRGLLFCGALIALVGSTTYGQDRPAAPSTPGAPAAEQPSQPAPGDAAPRRNVAGVYLCEGANPDGSPYKGLVEIVAIDHTYLVHWMMADGVEVLGVGIRNSDTLSVSYFGGTPALAVYRIEGDRLVGEWTMGGAEGMLYSETLTRMPEGTLQPRPDRPAQPRRARPVRGSRSV